MYYLLQTQDVKHVVVAVAPMKGAEYEGSVHAHSPTSSSQYPPLTALGSFSQFGYTPSGEIQLQVRSSQSTGSQPVP